VKSFRRGRVEGIGKKKKRFRKWQRHTKNEKKITKKNQNGGKPKFHGIKRAVETPLRGSRVPESRSFGGPPGGEKSYGSRLGPQKRSSEKPRRISQGKSAAQHPSTQNRPKEKITSEREKRVNIRGRACLKMRKGRPPAPAYFCY